MGSRSNGRTMAAVCIALAAATAVHAETLNVVVAQKGAWTTSMVDFGLKQGFFQQEDLDVSVIYTDGGAPTLQAVISGSVDIGIDNGILGVVGAYSKGAPVRVISASTTGAPDMYWYVKADSPIKNLKDAAGKTIGYSQNGSSSHLVLLAMLDQEKVAAKPFAAGGLPANLTQVMSNQIDIGWAVPAFGLQEIADGKIRIIARGNDVPAIRDETVRVNIVNLGVLQTRRAAVAKFMKVYVKTLDWAYESPQAIEYFAAGAQVSTDIARRVREEFYPKASMDPSQVKGLPLVLQQALDGKYITQPMTEAALAGLFDIQDGRKQ